MVVLLVVLVAVQLAQRNPAQLALLRGFARQGVLRALDRAEQQRARFEAAETVPVALLGGVDGEEVQRPVHDEPQYVRPFQRHAGESGVVGWSAEGAEGVDHRTGAVRGRGKGLHLSAP